MTTYNLFSVSHRDGYFSAFNSRSARRFVGLLCLAIPLALALPVFAQAPAILWTTHVGGTVFAVDPQTNVYAYNAGTVIVINAAGQATSSNSVCPAPGAVVAGMDPEGNFYFAGSYSGTQDFGGIKLTNNGAAAPFFCAKYNSSSSLVWVTAFGAAEAYYNAVGNIAVDPSGVVYVAYNNGYSEDGNYNDNSAVDRFDTNGTHTTVAVINDPYTYKAIARVGAVTTNSGMLLHYDQNPYPEGPPPPQMWYETWNGSSSATQAGHYQYSFSWNAFDTFAIPIANSQGEKVWVENGSLWKQNSQGSNILEESIGGWMAVAPELGGGVYVVNQGSQIARYDYNGNQVWALNLSVGNCVAMATDNKGNRFFSTGLGYVGLLANDYYSPSITNAPQPQIVFSGSNAVFSAGAGGSTPIYYQWLFQNAPLSGQTNATLTLQNVTTNAAGLYSVVVSNYVGSTTSSAVTLTVESVAIFDGSQMLTNGTYNFSNPPTLTIRSAFTNGEIFYSLDGSTPSFGSMSYSGPFVLSNSAVINAIGYSADFSQSAYADTVTATVPAQFNLAVNVAGGGTVSPSSGTYASNTLVNLVATPATGFKFLYWQGAAAGFNPETQLQMNQNQTVTAVFGTTLSTTVTGNGQILLAPPGGLYPYGTTVRLEALPQPGNYFGVWGNAASGNTNPLYFTITNATPTVSSIFGALASNQSALTVLILGGGKVGVNPAGNVFATNQSVIITATPNAGQSFLYWSGDASGSQNPLTVNMNQSRVIIAHFSGQTIGLAGTGGVFTPQGFQFNVTGDPESVYEILSSTDLTTWQSSGWLTNVTGVASFTDPSSTNESRKFYQAVLTQ